MIFMDIKISTDPDNLYWYGLSAIPLNVIARWKKEQELRDLDHQEWRKQNNERNGKVIERTKSHNKGYRKTKRSKNKT